MKNYNYIYVLYDVNEARVYKVFKICKKYLHHYQNSVFRGEITPSNIIKLRKEINLVIDKKTDKVAFIKMISKSSFDEENLGITNEKSENLFL